MFLLLAGFLMPALLVFGLFHLLTWVNLFGVNGKEFWRRVGLTSALSHIILACGFFAFSYVDYSMNLKTTLAGTGFDGFLFDQSEFWRLMAIFDTAPMLALLGLFAVLDRLSVDAPAPVAVSLAVTLAVGTVQWYFVGGGIGLLLERFWSGLKSDEDVDEDWL